MSIYASLLATTNSPAQDADIQQVEQLGGGAIPADYVAFLRTSNGGATLLDNLAFQTTRGPQATALESFLSVHSDGPLSVVATTEFMRNQDYLPPTALVVASDPAGNLVLLNTEPGDNFGAVYFWESDQADQEQSNLTTLTDIAHTVTKLADSFESFITTSLLSESDGEQRYGELENEPPLAAPTTPGAAPAPAVVSGVVLHHAAQLFDLRPPAFRPFAMNDAASFAADWTVPEAEWNQYAESDPYDMFEAGSSVAFRPQVLDQVRPIFERYGELLEFSTESGPVFYFRCLTIVDALSAETKIHVDGDNVSLGEPIFDANKLAGVGIFTVPQQPKNAQLFFTAEVAAEISATGIRHRDFLALDLPAQQK